MTDAPKKEPESNTATINFDYLKGSEFHVLHADGAFAALTTQGGITVSFFSERQPIPRRVVHTVNSDGSIGDEITEQRVVRDAIVRDVDVTVTMNLDTAAKVKDLLERLIGIAKGITERREGEKNVRS